MPKHRSTPFRNWFRRHFLWLFSREPSGGTHAAWEAEGIITRARRDAHPYIDPDPDSESQ